MRWTPGGASDDIEDRRSFGGGGGGGMRIGLGGVVLALVISYFTGQNPMTILQLISGASSGSRSARTGAPPTGDAARDPQVQFVSFVLDDAQQTWAKILPGYQKTKLVLFRDGVDSGCGHAEASTGPFYCPADGKVYIDLSFYEELEKEFKAAGDFAQAYVLAHEIGHHIQNITGIEEQVRRARGANPGRANQLSVLTELQADCYAGIWGHSTAQRDILEKGDVEEALNAASAIGDDRIQSRMRGQVRPETFTHGSSAQRVEWFRRGLETGSMDACNTFARR